MKNALYDLGLDNVTILRNFKDIKPLQKDDLNMDVVEPLNICTFSRVMKEKGIEDIVNAVKEVNEKYKKTIYTLDIYVQLMSNKQIGLMNFRSFFLIM